MDLAHLYACRLLGLTCNRYLNEWPIIGLSAVSRKSFKRA